MQFSLRQAERVLVQGSHTAVSVDLDNNPTCPIVLRLEWGIGYDERSRKLIKIHFCVGRTTRMPRLVQQLLVLVLVDTQYYSRMRRRTGTLTNEAVIYAWITCYSRIDTMTAMQSDENLIRGFNGTQLLPKSNEQEGDPKSTLRTHCSIFSSRPKLRGMPSTALEAHFPMQTTHRPTSEAKPQHSFSLTPKLGKTAPYT